LVAPHWHGWPSWQPHLQPDPQLQVASAFSVFSTFSAGVVIERLHGRETKAYADVSTLGHRAVVIFARQGGRRGETPARWVLFAAICVSGYTM
jgi:hypothetical protein